MTLHIEITARMYDMKYAITRSGRKVIRCDTSLSNVRRGFESRHVIVCARVLNYTM